MNLVFNNLRSLILWLIKLRKSIILIFSNRFRLANSPFEGGQGGCFVPRLVSSPATGFTFSILCITLSLSSCKAQQAPSISTSYPQDSVAERMLLYQRNNGGFPQPKGDPIDYQKTLSKSLISILLSEKDFLDATIDDKATTREINGLINAFQKTKNPAYLKAAENGIRYLLRAQNAAGGWGQFYPDSSGYHKHITYNDNAMIDVMYVIKNTAESTAGFEAVDKTLIPAAKKSLAKGIDCILKTQVIQNGKLTAWCAQYDRNTLKPAKARMFELPSLSGNESVGIVKFLMTIENPSPEIKQAINSAVAWFESVKIVGYKIQDIKDASQPKGKDRIIVPDPNSTIWARFYELETNKPFFAGRNSVVKYSLAEIENERRTGYAYYGTWATSLLKNDYPTWLKRVGNDTRKIVVSQDGTGAFRSIQEAINSLDTVSTSMRTIYIKNGTYHEKIYLQKSFIHLQGESEKGVIISTTLPRDAWRCENPDDYGAATVNVKGHDLIFEKLSIINDYGLKAKGDTTIVCVNESGKSGAISKDRYALPREKNETEGTKIVRKDGHQFAFRSMPSGTRLVFRNCTFIAGGGDTVSPWDVEGGLYYFKNCTMEGHVDFYCPRGWAWAEDCRFICHNMNAAIWHDGTNHESAKTVLKNCTFEGDKGYKLGRYHRPAQFYLLDCNFDENMADAPIYHVSSSPEPKWGHRVYFQNCHRKGGDFTWHANNLPIDVKNISLDWAFDGQWKSLEEFLK